MLAALYAETIQKANSVFNHNRRVPAWPKHVRVLLIGFPVYWGGLNLDTQQMIASCIEGGYTEIFYCF